MTFRTPEIEIEFGEEQHTLRLDMNALEIFEEETGKQFWELFEGLLNKVVEDPETGEADVPNVTVAEMLSLLKPKHFTALFYACMKSALIADAEDGDDVAKQRLKTLEPSYVGTRIHFGNQGYLMRELGRLMSTSTPGKGEGKASGKTASPTAADSR